MGAQARWLKRLELSTNYEDLREVFAAMATDAEAFGASDELAASIDMAIHRIEMERAEDERELDHAEEDYEAFREKQSGFIGWFKRHLPFTETRRREAAHKDTIEDRQAEVLADNLVIARSQMLKERLLDPAARRLGHDADHWEQRLAEGEARGDARALAASVRALGEEIERSAKFVDALSEDIEAFADADFDDEEDRERQKADLKAARREWKALSDEVRRERTARDRALAHLARFVTEALRDDDEYARAGRQTANLGHALERARAVESGFSKVRKILASLAAIAQELEDVPDERRALERKRRSAREDLQEAERTLTRARARFNELGGAAVAEAPPGLGEAESRLASAEHAVRRARSELDDVKDDEEKLERLADDLREQLEEGRRASDRRIDRTPALVIEYLRAIEPLGRRSSFHDPHRLPSGHASYDLGADRAKRLLEAVRTERAGLERDLAEVKGVRAAIWTRQAEALLGVDLAEEAAEAR